MTIEDYCISLNPNNFFLVVLGVVDMWHDLLNVSAWLYRLILSNEKFSLTLSIAQYDEPDLKKSQKTRPKTPTASKVIPLGSRITIV